MVRLFPRNPGKPKAHRRVGFNAKAEAHRVLDRARAGLPAPGIQVRWALRVTGDLE